jgi:hypothetical protein
MNCIDAGMWFIAGSVLAGWLLGLVHGRYCCPYEGAMRSPPRRNDEAHVGE